MYNVQKTNKSSKKTKLVIFSLVFLVAVGVTGFIFKDRILNDNATPESSQNATKDVDTIEQVNLDPPSEEVIAETEDFKSTLSEKKPTEQTDPSTKKSVKPVIVSAGQYEGIVEVSSYVQDVVEDGGVCKATLTNGAETKNKSSTGEKDVAKTLCPSISFEVGEVPAGSWSVVVSYDSSSAAGSSEPKTIEVQQ